MRRVVAKRLAMIARQVTPLRVPFDVPRQLRGVWRRIRCRQLLKRIKRDYRAVPRPARADWLAEMESSAEEIQREYKAELQGAVR